MSYALAGLGSSAAYKRYWRDYAKACRGMADEGACLTRAINHGVPVTFAGIGGYEGLGQLPPGVVLPPPGQATTEQIVASAMQTAANLTSIGAQIVANPQQFVTARAAPVVQMLDAAIVSPLVDRATQRATPYLVRYLLPPLTVLYIMSGLATFYSFEVLKSSRLKNNRMRRNRRRRRRN